MTSAAEVVLLDVNAQEDIAMALALTGQMLMNQAVMVKSSEVSALHACSGLRRMVAMACCWCNCYKPPTDPHDLQAGQCHHCSYPSMSI